MTKTVSEEISNLHQAKHGAQTFSAQTSTSLRSDSGFCAGGARPEPKKIRQRLRKDHCGEIRIGKTVYVDDLRWEWAQFDSYERWFEDWEDFLVHNGYAINTPTIDETTGEEISRITIPPEKWARIINVD